MLADSDSSLPKTTLDTIRDKKARKQPITFITAYDFPTAKLADEAGFDMILVGDTLAEVVLGYETTLPVSLEAMLHHTSAASRGVKRSLLVADLPYGSYHSSDAEGLRCALRFVKEAGAQVVKFEGGRKRLGLIRRMLDAEIPVMGHLGLTPQSIHRMGGYKVQAKTIQDIESLIQDAVALDRAGVFALVLEAIPREVSKLITDEVSAATLGIGAGPNCDGQVLVLNDILGLSFRRPAKFVRRYVDGASVVQGGMMQFRSDVESGAYPSDQESYHLQDHLRPRLADILTRVKALGDNSASC